MSLIAYEPYEGRLSRTRKLTRFDSRSPTTIDLRIDLSQRSYEK